MQVFFCMYKCTVCWVKSPAPWSRTRSFYSSSAHIPLTASPLRAAHCPDFRKHGSVWPVCRLDVDELEGLCSSLTGFFCSVFYLCSSSYKCTIDSQCVVFSCVPIPQVVIFSCIFWVFVMRMTIAYTDFYRL